MGKLSRSFDGIAKEYRNSRSEYPTDLIDFIINSIPLTQESSVLDVGCGSGQATIDLITTGCNVVAIDPAQRALDLLSQRCEGNSNLRLERTTFEEFEKPNSSFDLIVCAQAFHWLDPDTASKKIANLLRPSGHVMLFWHMQDVPNGSPQAELQTINSRYFSEYPTMNPPEYARPFLDIMAENLCKDLRLRDVQIREYPWERVYDRSEFLSLYRSWSKFATLPTAKKKLISRDLQTHLDSLADEPLIKYRTCLIHAHI